MAELLQLAQFAFAFLLTLGILVAIHEWGHYWVAKRLGVKILRYSLGFGKVIWSRRYGPDQTEFALAAIPLGGYVKMLDEREGEVKPEERHRAFNTQSLPVRAAIVAAGPLVNLLFAVLAFMLMFMLGVSGLRPLVGEVFPDSPAAQAGVVAGDEIIAVNQQPVALWSSAMQATFKSLLDQPSVTYQLRDESGATRTAQLDLSVLSVDDFSSREVNEKLGIQRVTPSLPAVVEEVLPNSRAEQAGFLPGDKIIAMAGEPIRDWQQWAERVSGLAEQDLSIVVERDAAEQTLMLRPENKEGRGFAGLAVAHPPSWPPEEYWTVEHYGLFGAFIKGWEQTWEYSIMTLRVLGKMLVLEASVKNISGPVTIAQYAGQSMSLGLAKFLMFLGMVSIGLGILNLLPIPVLDGGHLLLYLIEWLKGSPLSEQSESVFYRIGLTLVLMLMSLALFNDFNRLLQ